MAIKCPTTYTSQQLYKHFIYSIESLKNIIVIVISCNPEMPPLTWLKYLDKS